MTLDHGVGGSNPPAAAKMEGCSRIGNAPVLKTGAGNGMGVRIPHPPPKPVKQKA